MDKTYLLRIKKPVLQTLVALCLIILSSIAKNNDTVIFPSLLNPFVASANEQSTRLLISLPELADVILQDATTVSGKIVDIDSLNLKLTLKRGTKTRSVSLDKVNEVDFNPNSPYYRKDGSVMLRGLNKQFITPKGPPITLSGVPLSNFQMKKGLIGIAEVNLVNIVSEKPLSRMIAMSKKSTYVVDNLRFDAKKRTVTIKMTLYDK